MSELPPTMTGNFVNTIQTQLSPSASADMPTQPTLLMLNRVAEMPPTHLPPPTVMQAAIPRESLLLEPFTFFPHPYSIPEACPQVESQTSHHMFGKTVEHMVRRSE